MQQSVFGVKKEMDIESRIKAVQDAWDSSHPDCRFKVRLFFSGGWGGYQIGELI